MKNLIILTISFLLLNHLFGQKDTVFFFNEFDISLNRTNVSDNNTEDGFGFGFGAYGYFMDKKKIAVSLGLEFNKTNQLKKLVDDSHFSYSTNVNYCLNDLSIPIAVRLNFGNKTKLFVVFGPYLDISIASRKKGTRHMGNDITKYVDDVKEGFGNVGPYLGVGLRIPIAKHELVLKCDYKYGLFRTEDGYDYYSNRYYRLTIGFKI